MEFASGNFGMVESAYDYAMDTTPPKTSIEVLGGRGRSPSTSSSTGTTRPRSSTTRPTARRRRWRRRPTTPSARAGLGEVLTLTKLGATSSSGSPWTSRATSPRSRPSACWSAPSEEPGTVGGTVPATLALTARHAGHVRRVHPGRRARSTRRPPRPTVISTAGDATLTRRRPEHAVNTGQAGQRRVRAAAAAAGSRRRQDVDRPRRPTRRSRSRSSRRSAPTTRCARARTARRSTFTLSTTTP